MNEVAISRSPTRYPMVVVSSSDVFVMAPTRYSPTRYPITAFAMAPSIAFAVARLQNECMDVGACLTLPGTSSLFAILILVPWERFRIRW